MNLWLDIKRDKIMKILKSKKINLKITYPYPIYKMEPYKNYGNKKELQNTEKFSKEIFSYRYILVLQKKKFSISVII